MKAQAIYAGAALTAQLWLSQAAVQASGQASLVDCATPAPIARGMPNSRPPDYVIGPEDVLTVVFWGEQQLSGEVLVRPDGKISVPLLDDVEAAGLTPEQLRDRLVEKARLFVTDPIATVVVKAINSRKVYITGQVTRPGQYPFTPAMTVIQLIATAGGLGDFAKARDIRVVRVKEGRLLSIPFDYERVIRENAIPLHVELQPGDTVMVP